MPRPIDGDPTLLGIARRLENLARRWPDAKHAWAREMSITDGYPDGRHTTQVTPCPTCTTRSAV